MRFSVSTSMIASICLCMLSNSRDEWIKEVFVSIVSLARRWICCDASDRTDLCKSCTCRGIVKILNGCRQVCACWSSFVFVGMCGVRATRDLQRVAFASLGAMFLFLMSQTRWADSHRFVSILRCQHSIALVDVLF